MRISKSLFERIVREELKNYFEAKGDKDPDVQDADQERPPDEKKPGKDATPQKKAPPAQKPEPKADLEEPEKEPKQEKPPVLPAEDQPADADLEKQADDPVGAEDPEEDSGSQMSKEIEGKSVQSIVLEPKSKIVPGNKEIVLSFTQTPDPLRILVSPQGEIKFFYKSQIHNEV